MSKLKTLVFYGHSDDCFCLSTNYKSDTGLQIDSGGSYIISYYYDYLRITGIYKGPDWNIEIISSKESNKRWPGVQLLSSICPNQYSPLLSIEVPEGASITYSEDCSKVIRVRDLYK